MRSRAACEACFAEEGREELELWADGRLLCRHCLHVMAAKEKRDHRRRLAQLRAELAETCAREPTPEPEPQQPMTRGIRLRE